jgi:hypothetical protein
VVLPPAIPLTALLLLPLLLPLLLLLSATNASSLPAHESLLLLLVLPLLLFVLPQLMFVLPLLLLLLPMLLLLRSETPATGGASADGTVPTCGAAPTTDDVLVGTAIASPAPVVPAPRPSADLRVVAS